MAWATFRIKTIHHRRSNLRWTSNVARERQLPLFA